MFQRKKDEIPSQFITVNVGYALDESALRITHKKKKHKFTDKHLIYSPTPIFSSSVGVHILSRCPNSKIPEKSVITRCVASWSSSGGVTRESQSLLQLFGVVTGDGTITTRSGVDVVLSDCCRFISRQVRSDAGRNVFVHLRCRCCALWGEAAAEIRQGSLKMR